MGIARLSQLRGPLKAASGHAHTSFLQCRIAQLASSLSSRKASMFQSHEWRSVPWTYTPKTDRDRIFDILLIVPGVVEASDGAIRSRSSSSRLQAMNSLLQIHTLLDTWRHDFTAQLWSEVPGSEISSAEDWVAEHPEYYMEHGLDVGSWFMLYWTTSMQVCTSLRVLSSLMPEGYVCSLCRCT